MQHGVEKVTAARTYSFKFSISHMIHKGKDKQLRILNLVIYLEILTVESLPLNKGNMSPAISFETLETHGLRKERSERGEFPR